MSDHYAEAVDADQLAMNSTKEMSRMWHRKAQVHAALALAEQQRIANLIALAGMTFPDGRTHMAHLVTDPLEYNGIKVKPEIARTLRIETQ